MGGDDTIGAAHVVRLTFKFPSDKIDGEGRVRPEKLSEILTHFQKKLVGVKGEHAQADDGSITVSLHVAGGADLDHLGRLWREHLQEHGISSG